MKNTLKKAEIDTNKIRFHQEAGISNSVIQLFYNLKQNERNNNKATNSRVQNSSSHHSEKR